MSEYQPRVGDLWVRHTEEGDDECQMLIVEVDRLGVPRCECGTGWGQGGLEMTGYTLVARGARTMADRALLGEFDEKPEAPSEVDLLRERVAELEVLCEARGVAQKQANDAADASTRMLASLLEPKPDETAADWAESVGR